MRNRCACVCVCVCVSVVIWVYATIDLGNVVPVQVYVRIDASVYDVSKMYVSNRSGKG